MRHRLCASCVHHTAAILGAPPWPSTLTNIMMQSFFDEFAEDTAKAGATADSLLLQARNEIIGEYES
jgi:hypothetical protein